ncbi:MAG: ABC transporter ATP-binding protein [Opitutales bacterium]|nr:ABC transporter ATP-binding protein [Opitutales bacterium]
MRNICLTRRNRQILNHIDLDGFPGQVLGLIGANGSGKSTLLKSMIGLLPANSGTILLEGIPLNKIPARDSAKKISYMGQENECQWPLQVRDVVALGRMPHQGTWSQKRSTEDEANIEAAMQAVDICHLQNRTVTRLSGGERRRVLLARALAGKPKLLLADEPTSGLDPYHQLQLMELFRKQAEKGIGIIVVIHELTLASRFCDRIILLKSGKILSDGPPSTVLNQTNLATGYNIQAALLDYNGDTTVVPWCCCQKKENHE